MTIRDCFYVSGFTVLIFDEPIPAIGWHTAQIDGNAFEPVPVMDAKVSCIAISGRREFKGKTVTFS